MLRPNAKPSSEERMARYEALIKQLESLAKESPNTYKLRIRLLMALGYGYLALLLLICVGLLWLVFWGIMSGNAVYILIKGGWMVLIFIYIILRALWVKLPVPTHGVELQRADYPQLFGMLDDISKRLQSPSFNVVRLSRDLNASVLQLPRYGIFGGYRNYLEIGLPLLHSLSPEEFKSIIAHEFGHLSGNHSRFGNKIYRSRVTWYRLAESFEQGTIFTKFFQWYIPYMSAYTFVLARANEYIADQCAVEITSAKVFGNSLLKTEVAAQQFEEKFWTLIGAQVKSLAQPPARPFSEMASALRATPDRGDFVGWMDDSLRKKTDYDDTHPSATDRLKAVGYSQTPLDAETIQLEPTETTAAEFYLGAKIPALTAVLEREWTEEIAPEWEQRYHQHQEIEKELHKLEQKTEPLTESEQLHRMEWTEIVHSPEQALPLYQEYLSSHPDNARVNFETGRLLLQVHKDPSGVPLVEKAMQLEPYSVFIGCKLLYGFLSSQHREEEAEAYRKHYLKQLDEYERGQVERQALTRKDVFFAPDLKPEVLMRLQEQLAQYEMLAEVYLVRKETTSFSTKPFYVFMVKIKVPFTQETNSYVGQVLQNIAQNLEFPHEYYLFSIHKYGQFLKRIKEVPGSAIYKKA